jgi:hypothetical protein
MAAAGISTTGQNMIAVVVPGVREPVGIAPGVVEAQARAMVDRPQVLVPDQQIGIASAAIDVGDEGVQPDHSGRVLGWQHKGPVISNRSRQEVDGEIQTGAGRDQFLNLLIWFSPPDFCVDVD